MSPLVIQPITFKDVPALSQLWYTSFSIPVNLRMFPDTPGARAWCDEANRSDLLYNPLRVLLKVVDPATPDLTVAYAKWDLNPAESRERFPPWHEESDHKTCERLFSGLAEERKQLLGDRKHYCTSTT